MFGFAQFRNLFVLAAAVAACAASAEMLRAQLPVMDPGSAAVAVVEEASSPEALRARLAEVEAATELSDGEREALRADYNEALELLGAAESSAERTRLYREALATGRSEAGALRKQLDALPSVGDVAAAARRSVPVAEGNDALKERLAQESGALAEFKSSLEEFERRLHEEGGRPAVSRMELEAARRALAAAEAGLSAGPPRSSENKSDAAKLALLEVKRRAAAATVEMLEEEERSYSSRFELLTAERDLAAKHLADAEARVGMLREIADERLAADVSRTAMAAREAESRSEEKPAAVRELSAEIAGLSREYEAVADRLREVGSQREAVDLKLKQMAQNADRIRTQFEIGGLEGAFAQILLDQDRRLPHPRFVRRELVKSNRDISAVRLAAFRIDDRIRQAAAAPEEAARILGEEVSDEAAGKQGAAIRNELVELAAVRQELWSKVSSEYRRLIGEMGQLDLARRQYAVEVEDFRGFLAEKLFWVRTSPAIGAETVKAIPAAVSWLAGRAHWPELASLSMKILRDSPVSSAAVVLVLAVLTGGRRRIVNRLSRSGQRIRRASTDRFAFTLEALLLTVLLALPTSLFLAFAGLKLVNLAVDSEWVQGLGFGFAWSAVVWFVFEFLIVLCRPKGLGEVHFAWSKERVALLRGELRRLAAVLVPASFVIAMTMCDSTTQHLQSVGRLTFIGAMIWGAFVLNRVARPTSRILGDILARDPEGWINRLRRVWHPLLVASPVFLAILAMLGYFITALHLNFLLEYTLVLLAGGLLVYNLLLRWLAMKQRKIVLKKKLAERRERKKAEEAAGAGASAEESVIAETEALEMDRVLVGLQTRRLLRFLVGAAIAVGIWFVWASMLPAIGVLNAKPLVGGATAADLILVVALVIATLVTARNLPGLLEVAVLRNLPFDAGSRFAIATLAQYGVIFFGIVAISQVLELDGSKLGWIAAALSVGLGFGLQEVVANFICGIILLFERPVRVGDIVTIADVTGVVSRIRIRATTITNWDRKEFIVPNKEFVTGNLMNWTLSNSINRIVFSVGVAYGSDTEKAREILLEIADAHREIIDDPPPIAVFEEFGDSTLNFTMRCYLSKLDRRLQTTHEVNTEINRRFAEAGIEIAFPQRDLHLRSVDPEARGEVFPGDGAGA